MALVTLANSAPEKPPTSPVNNLGCLGKRRVTVLDKTGIVAIIMAVALGALIGWPVGLALGVIAIGCFVLPRLMSRDGMTSEDKKIWNSSSWANRGPMQLSTGRAFKEEDGSEKSLTEEGVIREMNESFQSGVTVHINGKKFSISGAAQQNPAQDLFNRVKGAITKQNVNFSKEEIHDLTLKTLHAVTQSGFQAVTGQFFNYLRNENSNIRDVREPSNNRTVNISIDGKEITVSGKDRKLFGTTYSNPKERLVSYRFDNIGYEFNIRTGRLTTNAEMSVATDEFVDLEYERALEAESDSRINPEDKEIWDSSFWTKPKLGRLKMDVDFTANIRESYSKGDEPVSRLGENSQPVLDEAPLFRTVAFDFVREARVYVNGVQFFAPRGDESAANAKARDLFEYLKAIIKRENSHLSPNMVQNLAVKSLYLVTQFGFRNAMSELWEGKLRTKDSNVLPYRSVSDVQDRIANVSVGRGKITVGDKNLKLVVGKIGENLPLVGYRLNKAKYEYDVMNNQLEIEAEISKATKNFIQPGLIKKPA